MKGTPLDIIRTFLQHGKVTIHPSGDQNDRYTIELELKSGEVFQARSDSIEKTVEKMLEVLDEHIRKRSKEKK